jgi:putative heme-binding domain-containing protein
MLPIALAVLAQITVFDQLPRENPYTSAADLAAGRKTFEGQCGGCHGPKGEGGRGPSLQQAVLPSAPSDVALFGVLRRGIPGTEMPAITQVSDREVWQVIAYTRSLGQLPREAVRGSVAAGKALYFGKAACWTCHLNREDPARGRPIGPDLSDIGVRRSPTHLRDSLVTPEAHVPDGFVTVSYTAPGGESGRALRLNEDTFSVRLLDLKGEVRSFWKDELKAYRLEPGASLMPSYATRLSPAELDDLTAYLSTLGAKP